MNLHNTALQYSLTVSAMGSAIVPHREVTGRSTHKERSSLLQVDIELKAVGILPRFLDNTAVLLGFLFLKFRVYEVIPQHQSGSKLNSLAMINTHSE